MGYGAGTEEVHTGRNGYLFLSGGSHGVFSYFTGKREPEPGSPETFRENLESRAAWCDRNGLLFRMAVFPEKCVALSDEIGLGDDFLSLYQRHYADEVARAGAAGCIRYPIEAIRSNHRAFSRTDTHYAAWGNLAMTEAILGDVFPDLIGEGLALLQSRIREKPGFSGDLGRKFDPPQTETCAVLKERAVPFTMASNGLKGGNDGICVLISSPDALTGKTLLIYGDSFFRQLLPMLAVFYRRVIFCRTRFFHYEMLGAFRPDHVFCGLAERYLSRCSPDAMRPHFLSYPLVLGRSSDPEPEFSGMWQDFVAREELLA